MSEDAAYELQRAIYAILIADAGFAALADDRVYDRAPDKVQFPYVSFGPSQEIPEAVDCIDAAEIIIQIDAWSRDPGEREVKQLAKAIKAALDGEALQLSDNALVYFEYSGRRVMKDPDGITSHAVLTFRAGVENH